MSYCEPDEAIINATKKLTEYNSIFSELNGMFRYIYEKKPIFAYLVSKSQTDHPLVTKSIIIYGDDFCKASPNEIESFLAYSYLNEILSEESDRQKDELPLPVFDVAWHLANTYKINAMINCMLKPHRKPNLAFRSANDASKELCDIYNEILSDVDDEGIWVHLLSGEKQHLPHNFNVIEVGPPTWH